MEQPLSDSEVLLKVLKLKFGDQEYKVPVLRMTPAAARPEAPLSFFY